MSWQFKSLDVESVSKTHSYEVLIFDRFKTARLQCQLYQFVMISAAPPALQNLRITLEDDV